MSDVPKENSSESRLSPQEQRKFQKIFEHGNKQMQLGAFDYATDMFSSCVAGDPQNILYMNSFIVNLRVKYGDNKKGAKKLFRGVKPYKTAELRKNWNGVIQGGLEALKVNPWDAEAFLAISHACMELGYEDAALAWLKHSVEAEPENIDNNRFAGQELYRRGRFDDALACWQRILKVKSDDSEAGRMVSDILLEKTIEKNKFKKPEEIEEDDDRPKLSKEDEFERQIKKDPDSRELYRDMADYFNISGNLKKVEDTYRRALKIYPDDVEFMPKYLEVQKQRSRNDLEKLIALYKKEPSEELKERYVKLKNDYEAKRLNLILYKLEKNPQDTASHYEYGLFLRQHGKIKEAISEFQAAKADVSVKKECLVCLATCFQQIKQYRLAMMHYDEVLEMLSDTDELTCQALYQAAKLSFSLEDIKKAEKYATRLASIDFSYKDLGDLLDKIEKKSHN